MKEYYLYYWMGEKAAIFFYKKSSESFMVNAGWSKKENIFTTYLSKISKERMDSRIFFGFGKSRAIGGRGGGGGGIWRSAQNELDNAA